jgi:hypothetical protein
MSGYTAPSGNAQRGKSDQTALHSQSRLFTQPKQGARLPWQDRAHAYYENYVKCCEVISVESTSVDSIPSSWSFLSKRADSRLNSLMRASRVAFKKNSLRSAFCLGDFCTVIPIYDNNICPTFKKLLHRLTPEKKRRNSSHLCPGYEPNMNESLFPDIRLTTFQTCGGKASALHDIIITYI